jgi:hypothetical protein
VTHGAIITPRARSWRRERRERRRVVIARPFVMQARGVNVVSGTWLRAEEIGER